MCAIRTFIACDLLLVALTGMTCVAAAQPVRIQPDVTSGDAFGTSVALSGAYALVGAPGDSDNAGAVYVFRLTDNEWRQEAKLVSPNAATARGFGRSIALDGHTAVIGEPVHAGLFTDAGAAFIFERDASGAWQLTQSLVPPKPRIATNFGHVALKGDTLFVGAMGATDTVERQGVVYVYARHYGGSHAWGLVTTLTAADAAFGDVFGRSIAPDGALVGVGALGQDARYPDAGAAYLFVRRASAVESWGSPHKLIAADGSNGDAFGASVAAHGRRVLVGAPQAKGTNPDAGAAYLFARSESNAEAWHHVAKLTASDGARHDRFGATLAMNEDWIAVGAPSRNGLGDDTGAIYLFAPQSGGATAWHQVAKLTAPSGEAYDSFGASLALQENLLIVGAPGATSGAGTTFVYDLSTISTAEMPAFERLVWLNEDVAYPRVEAMVQDHEGFLWLGTHDGLHRFDGYALTSYRHIPGDTTSLSPGPILSLLEDQERRLWVGTEQGISRFDRRQDRFVRYVLAAENTYPRQSVRVLFEDRQGTLWTGTNGRLYAYDAARDRFVVYAPFSGLPEDLDERYISGIQQDSTGQLWVLSKNLWEHRASLYQIDLTTDRVTRFALSSEWGQLGPFLIDSRDVFWLKAPSPIAAPEEAEAVVYPPVSPLDVPHWTFYEDRSGVVWVGTLNGLYRHDPAGPKLHLEGPEPPVFGHPTLSLYETRSGQVLLGTLEGVFQSTRPLALGTSVRPPIVLTGVQVASREGTAAVSAYGLTALTLSHDDYSVGFEYTALTFAPPEQNHYRYRMAGFDREWVDAGPRRFATYSNLRPGRYTFEVVLAQDDGAIEKVRFALPVVVNPAFWQTGWFRGAMALLLVGLLAAVYRYRVRQLLKMQRLRLRIASDLHDDVSSNLSGIALMSELVRQQPSLAPEQQHQLARIADTAQQTVEDLRHIVWLVDPGHDRLQDLLLKMKDTAATLLDGVLYTFRTPDATDPGPLDMAFRRQVYLIYKEILHNIVRHAQATSVAIEVRWHRNLFVLHVQDNGMGFDPGRVHQGHGLRNMHRRAEALGAHLEINSAHGKGTQVTLTLKMA